jgi:multidrug efflux pump
MSRLIAYAIDHARLTLATLAFLLLAGLVAYRTIPKEAEPDVKVPIIYVQLTQRGISPEDAERLLLRPVETQLKSVGNVKEMRATAYEGGGYVLLEFEAGFNSDAALADVRAKVDQSKRDLPKDADEPAVTEVNLSLYPVLVVTLAGELPERSMLRIARDAKNRIEQQPGVLSATLRGTRDEAVEITAEPMLMKSYNISLDQLIAVTQSSNSLIAAGALEGASGRFAVKVPGLIEHPEDMLKIPVVSTAGATVTLGDIATVKPTFKDATSVTRVDGKPAMTIEVSKRTGANLIETVDGVKQLVAQMQKTWPGAVKVGYTQDKSKLIRQMLADLQNSVATGVLLVAVIILFALGFRSSLFIGIAIPASFLAGVLGLQLAGLTVNIVVLFSLILAVGMLVDDAIIVSEYAERRMAEGMAPKQAYTAAATRMAGPVIAATATRIAAFSPLLFWPGIVGQFMKYMPITLIATLSASLAVALFFTPTLGALLGRAAKVAHDDRAAATGPYMRSVKFALHRPGLILILAFMLLVTVIGGYAKFGNGVEFFPSVEPDYGQVIVHARGNLSLDEKDKAVRQVEKTVLATQDGLHARRRTAARLQRNQRRYHRRHSVRIRRLAATRAGPCHHGQNSRGDVQHRRHSGRGHGAARRSADRQGDPGATVRHRSGQVAGRRQEGRRPSGPDPGSARPRRWSAAARHRLEDSSRQGRGGKIRRRPQLRRQRGATGDQRLQGHRVPACR